MMRPYVPYDGPAITREGAKAAGLSRFFTGIPCKRGHHSQRLTHNAQCAECAKGYRHTEAAKAGRKRRKWKPSPEKALQYTRVYRERNREAARERTRLSMIAWRLANPGKNYEKVKEWRAKNWDSVKAHNAKRRATENAAEGSFSASDVADIRRHQAGKCAYCKVKLKKCDERIDHIVSLVNGGSNWPRNLQLLCEPCNSRKSKKDPIVFAQQQGFLI